MSILKVVYAASKKQELNFVDDEKFELKHVLFDQLKTLNNKDIISYVFFLDSFELPLLDRFLSEQALPVSVIFYYKKGENELDIYQSVQCNVNVSVIHEDYSPEQKRNIFEQTVFNSYNHYLSKKKQDIQKNKELSKLNERSLLEDKYLFHKSNVLNYKREIKSISEKMSNNCVFYKSLFSVSSIEDFFSFIKREVKIFNPIPSFFFLIRIFNRNILFYFNGSYWLQKTIENQFLFNEKVSSYEIRRYLADSISRPINLVTPIFFNHLKSIKAFLCFEHQMSKESLESFNAFIDSKKNLWGFILDRISNEIQLKESYKMWENTFNRLQDPLVLLNKSGKVIKSNLSFKDNILKQVQKDDYKVSHGTMIKLSNKNKVLQVESFLVNERFNESGSFVQRYVDITDYMEIKKRSLQSEKLKAIGSLTAHFRKKLETPLKKINLLSKEIDFNKSDFLLQKDLEKLKKSNFLCQSILKDLSDFLNSENESQLELVDLNTLVKKTFPFLKTALIPFNYKVKLSEKKLHINAVPQLVQQVIFNITHNACQAMNKNGNLTIVTECLIKSQEVLLKIKDTGTGIDQCLLDQIFDPFFTTKSLGKGTGLGLNISKSIIEKLGGRIEVESELNKGTEFSIFFPYCCVA